LQFSDHAELSSDEDDGVDHYGNQGRPYEAYCKQVQKELSD